MTTRYFGAGASVVGGTVTGGVVVGTVVGAVGPFVTGGSVTGAPVAEGTVPAVLSADGSAGTQPASHKTAIIKINKKILFIFCCLLSFIVPQDGKFCNPPPKCEKQKLSASIITFFSFKSLLSHKCKSAFFTNFRHNRIFLCIYYEKLQKT